MNLHEVERGRVNLAYEQVKKVKKSFAEEYKSNVKKMPIYIKTNGLLGALVFAYSRKKDSWNEILKNIKEYIEQDMILATFKSVENLNLENFIKKITELEIEEYNLITNQILAYLNWLRRISEGMIDKNESNKETTEPENKNEGEDEDEDEVKEVRDE